MALVEMMAFLNAGILIVAFALLLVVLSFSVSQINSTSVFANSESVATGIGTRLITSPNCFAYKNTISYYNSTLDAPGGPLYSSSYTEPGVVNVNKFIENYFLSCMQYIYFGGSTNIPALQSDLAAATGVSLTLYDTQDPNELGPTGSLYFSNYNQFNFGESFQQTEALIEKYAQVAEDSAMAASLAVSLPIMIATGGAIQFNIILAVGQQSTTEIAPQYALASIFYSENTYTESFPVEIQFTNAQGQPTFQNSGVLQVDITYGIPPYS
ncbi:hypothetical protein M1494_00460 [Candidatus Parvarchaeota archaeon]|nr:hypothetical protein [Candidatus Parvarchaeota archaeon]